MAKEVCAVPLVVVSEKEDRTPLPVPVKLNVPPGAVAFFTTTRSAFLVLAKVQVTLSPAFRTIALMVLPLSQVALVWIQPVGTVSDSE